MKVKLKSPDDCVDELSEVIFNQVYDVAEDIDAAIQRKGIVETGLGISDGDGYFEILTGPRKVNASTTLIPDKSVQALKQYRRFRAEALDVLLGQNVIYRYVPGKSDRHGNQIVGVHVSDYSTFRHFFDALVKRKKSSTAAPRRVTYDAKNGHLSLDGKRVYTASLTGPEYQFLSVLWDKWEQQVPYTEIYKQVREKMGMEVADTPQIFCSKMKSNIKAVCPQIEAIITIPTRKYFMMADPLIMQ